MHGWKISLLLLLLNFTATAEELPSWRRCGPAEWKSTELPGRVNISSHAVLSESGGLYSPLWTIENLVAPTPRDCLSHPLYRANTSLNAGWNSATTGAIDPHPPFLQFDFPSEKPVPIDTLMLESMSVPAPEYRPLFIIERRLGQEWQTIYQPTCREDENSSTIRFAQPFLAQALRVRFINPSPSSYLLMRRFWIFSPEKVVWPFRGGRIDFFTPEQKPTEKCLVFPPENPVRFRAVYTPYSGNRNRTAKMVFQLTNYYGEVISGTKKSFDVKENEAAVFPLEYPAHRPGAYYLEATLESGDTVFLRARLLWGIKGISSPPQGIAQLSKLPKPEFELAGGIGQNYGPGQRKSTTAIDAYKRLHTNTIQLEMLWRDIEPLPGVYEFDELDRIFLYAARQGFHVNISLYATDGNMPPWLLQPQYAMLDHYGNPAVGRTEWQMLLVAPPSSHAPIYREHYREVWKAIASRYTPSGRILRFDLRPSLCERFYFDDFVNAFRGSDGVCDYSEWARLDYIKYLRDFRKFSLAEVSQRTGEKLTDWAEVTLPRPARGYTTQKLDKRVCWQDFLDFKNHYHPAEFFLETVTALTKINPEAQVFLRYHDYFYDEFLRQNRLAGGYFDIEHGVPYFALRKPILTSQCFEWGEPFPPYEHFNAGLFYILPRLHGNALRWVYSPCLDDEKYNVPKYWKSYESLSRLAPHLSTLTAYKLPHSEVALFGGFDQEFGLYETARPVRHPMPGKDLYTKLMCGNYGGLYAVYWGALFFNGLLPYEDFATVSGSEIKLVLDGGNADCSRSEQEKLLAWVESGGKVVLWSNSCRYANGKPEDLIRRTLGITGHFELPAKETQTIQFNFADKTFSGRVNSVFVAVKAERGRVVGRINGQPAAWLIPYGRGEVLYVNGLPQTEKITDWVDFMELVADWAGLKPHFKAQVSGIAHPFLLGYAMSDSSGDVIFTAYNNSDGDPLIATVRYWGILAPEKEYRFSVLHATEKDSQLRTVVRNGADATLELQIKKQDMMIIKAQVIASKKVIKK